MPSVYGESLQGMELSRSRKEVVVIAMEQRGNIILLDTENN
jgi:hypothetical protein